MTDTKQIEPLSIDDISTLLRRLEDHRGELVTCERILQLYDGNYRDGSRRLCFYKKEPVRVVYHLADGSDVRYGSLGITANPQAVLGLVHQRLGEVARIIRDIEADFDRRGIKHGN